MMEKEKNGDDDGVEHHLFFIVKWTSLLLLYFGTGTRNYLMFLIWQIILPRNELFAPKDELSFPVDLTNL